MNAKSPTFAGIMKKLIIRPYKKEDQDNLIKLFLLNTPEFFDISEKQHLIDYLSDHSENYFVVETLNKIIGSGGFNTGFDEGRTIRISWDMIHPDYQGNGIGKKLLKYRIEKIKSIPGVKNVIVRTTQLVYQFYQKSGFELEMIDKDFWATGYDLYTMKMELT